MSERKKNRKQGLLIALAVVLLVGTCFTCVGLYAKKELSKPKFTPPDATLDSARDLPESKADVLAYVQELYYAAAASENVEISWHTDAKLKDYDKDIMASVDDKDLEIFKYIREHANDDGKITDMYSKADNVVKAENEGLYKLDITEDQILEFSAERGRTDDKGNYVDDDLYFINFTVDPSVIDAASIPDGEIYKKFAEAFSPAFSVDDVEFEVTGVTMSFKIARAWDELKSLEIKRSYLIKSNLTLTDDYSAMAAEGEKGISAALPYESTEKISFRYYGAHFTGKSIVNNPGDMQALPADVRVKTDASPDEFSLKFDVSEDGVLKIDEDGVMTVLKAVDDPVTITMTLDYNGKTYTDDLLVYITEMEVATENGQ
ncbi:MAG: hypothetical protein IJS90_04605 [Clostridia bacterium]|nr:hypothetical protein [Clostridia bacterium]